jgi:uncharacterized flavoprotein (TIGR03862 family)
MMAATEVALAVIGGGPAGLMAAETAARAGIEVHLFERKGSVGRKFLIAGRGGLNLTHSDEFDVFAKRYREQESALRSWLSDFNAQDLREWAKDLGIDTFVGSSGRVFPTDMKAAPLLRAWVKRLRDLGVQFHVNHDWQGWNAQKQLVFMHENQTKTVNAKATVLALGGASWPQLGSDGSWQSVLKEQSIDIEPLKPSNCGFDLPWTDIFKSKFAGHPLKPIKLHWQDTNGKAHILQGECVISDYGIEGSAIYAASADIRDVIQQRGAAIIELDLMPNKELPALLKSLGEPRGNRSISEYLRRKINLSGVKLGLLYELLDRTIFNHPETLAQTIKRLPLRLQSARPVAEVISSAGGVKLEAMNQSLMLNHMPGIFCAGEMLDWEAPTGGYLLTACYASGVRAGKAAAEFIRTLR